MAAVLVATTTVVVAPTPATAQYPGANGKWVFVRGSGTTYDIYTSSSQGKNLKKLTTTPGFFGSIDWAPDGSKFAYESFTSDEKVEIWVMNADGSGNRRVNPAGSQRYSPSWDPSGRYLAVDNGVGEIYRIDTVSVTEELIKETDMVTGECLGNPDDRTVYYSSPSWSPDGGRIAVVVSHELPTVPPHCDPNPNFKIDLGVMASGGGDVVKLTDDEPGKEVVDTLPDWSPDGSRIVFQRGIKGSQFGVATILSGGGGLNVLTAGAGGRPRYSPDGSKIIFLRDKNADGNADIWTMNASDGSDLKAVIQDDKHHAGQDWQPVNAEGLDVSLDAFGPDGTSLDGAIGVSSIIDVELTITNTTEEDVTDLSFANDAPLVIDDDSTGGVEITAGPDPAIDPDLTLEPDEEVTFTFELEMTENGLAAAHTKVFAEGGEGQVSGAFSLLLEIADGAELTKELGEWLKVEAMSQVMQKAFQGWYEGMRARGQGLADQLSAVLSPAERQKWFGAASGLGLSAFDYAMGALRGMAPEMIAATLPEDGFKGHSWEELEAEYNKGLKAELGKGVKDYVDGYAGLAASAKKGLQDTWGEVMIASYNFFGTQTPEEQQQFAAQMYAVAQGTDTSVDNLVNSIGRELPKMRENLTYFDEALDMVVADAFLLSPDIQAQIATEKTWNENVFKMAQSNPLGFQQAVSKRDGEIISLVLPIILDTLIGGGVTKLGGKLKGIVVKGEGAAVMRSGEALGVVDDTGKVAKGPKTDVVRNDSATPSGPSATEIAEAEASSSNWLDDVEGATVVQSTDAGKVYELPNVGGVPEITLDAKAEILGELEDAWTKKSGKQLQLAEVLKPSSAYRKVDGVAKTELTKPKSGKAAMLDAGAPKEILSEASVWKAPDPTKSKDFKSLSKTRQQAAVKEWEKANEAWDTFKNPPLDSMEFRMKQCIGKRTRVPLDLEPNPQGIQRFATAEYEVVDVVDGDVQAKLFRVKYYEVEVFDTNTGKSLNKKVVVDSPTALPQTPDADAAGIGKVIGVDDAGDPIIAPLSREEREFIMPRYMDKNIKARRKKPGTKGAIPDAAEHGVSSVMDDASASVAGKLLAKYFFPFMREGPGLKGLARISKTLAGKNPTGAEVAKMYHQLVAMVRSEGGFGQHAVILTRDSRYLGEVPFESW